MKYFNRLLVKSDGGFFFQVKTTFKENLDSLGCLF